MEENKGMFIKEHSTMTEQPQFEFIQMYTRVATLPQKIISRKARFKTIFFFLAEDYLLPRLGDAVS